MLAVIVNCFINVGAWIAENEALLSRTFWSRRVSSVGL